MLEASVDPATRRMWPRTKKDSPPCLGQEETSNIEAFPPLPSSCLPLDT